MVDCVSKNKQVVYLMKNEIGLYKIGVSKDPKARSNTIKLNSGMGVDVIKTFKTKSDARFVEGQLHKKYKDYRKCGEWFKFDKGVLKTIPVSVREIDTPTVVFRKSVVDTYYDEIVGYDEAKLSDRNYCKDLYEKQFSTLLKLYKKDFTSFVALVDKLKDNCYDIPYSVVYCTYRKEDNPNLGLGFSCMLNTTPIVLTSEVKKVKIGYLEYTIQKYKDALEKMKGDT